MGQPGIILDGNRGISPSKIKEVLERVNLLDRAKDKYKHTHWE